MKLNIRDRHGESSAYQTKDGNLLILRSFGDGSGQIYSDKETLDNNAELVLGLRRIFHDADKIRASKTIITIYDKETVKKLVYDHWYINSFDFEMLRPIASWKA